MLENKYYVFNTRTVTAPIASSIASQSSCSIYAFLICTKKMLELATPTSSYSRTHIDNKVQINIILQQAGKFLEYLAAKANNLPSCRHKSDINSTNVEHVGIAL
jgi:hypothetical protein